MMTNKKTQHDKDLDQIILHPDIIDINPNNIDIRMKEILLYKRRNIYREPDAIFYDCKNHKIYIIEYKSTENKSSLKKAVSQLTTTQDILYQKIPSLKEYDMKLIIAYEKNKYITVK